MGAVALLAPRGASAGAQPLEPFEGRGGADGSLAEIEGLANRAGIEVTVLGEPPEMEIGVEAAALDAGEAIELLRRRSGDRIEVYALDGELQQLVMVARDQSPVRASLGAAPRRPPRTTSDQEDLSVREALRLAPDRSAHYADRLRAIAELGRSGLRQAVDVLKEIAAEGGGGLGRAAVAALGGFKETPSEQAARDALEQLETIDQIDPIERAAAEAAYESSALIETFLSGLSTTDRMKVIALAPYAQQGSALTDFFLEALQDPSISVRVTAAHEIARAGGGVDDRAGAALLEMASSDPVSGVRNVAAVAHSVWEAGSGLEIDPEAPPLPRRLDKNPLMPGSE